MRVSARRSRSTRTRCVAGGTSRPTKSRSSRGSRAWETNGKTTGSVEAEEAELSDCFSGSPGWDPIVFVTGNLPRLLTLGSGSCGGTS